MSPLTPVAYGQSTITVDFDRVVFYDRNEDLIYRDYNVQEGATLRPILKFSAATPSAATFSVLAEAGTAPAEAGAATADVDFPAGLHTFTVPAGSIRHSFEISIPWDAEIEGYENFTLTLQTPPSGYALRHATATVQIVNVALSPSDWTLNPSGLTTGDQYRLLFKTGNRRNGASSNIDVYDAFVRNRSSDHPWHPDIEKYADTFRVVGSVHRWVAGTTPSNTRRVDASWRTATGVTLRPQRPNLPGHTTFTTPIYWLNGVQIAPHHNQFWTGAWGDANAEANQRHADGEAATTTQGANTGTLDSADNNSVVQQIAGTHQRSRALGNNVVAYGHDGPAPDRLTSAIWLNTHSRNNLRPYFGISAVHEVGDFQTADPVVSIEGLGRIHEGGDASFTVTASAAPTSDLTINLNVRESTVGGANYVANGQEGDRTVVIRAGQRTAKLTVPTTGHPRREPDGRVIASILPGSGYAAADHTDPNMRSWHRTSVRSNNDVIQLSDATRSVAEFGNHKDNGGVRISVQIGGGMNPQGHARTINYTVGGTATRGDGKDYTIDGCTSSTCSVRLRANTYGVPITIYVNNDGLDENDETIILTLQDGSGYTLNKDKRTATVTIGDDDTRGLSFRRRWADVKEGASETYTVKLRSQPTAAVTVGIVSNNPDVTVSPTSLTFNPSGSNLWSRARAVTVSAAQDSDAVDDEATLTHTTSGGDYGGTGALSIGRPVSVDDDDTSTTTTGPQLPRISLAGGSAVTEGAAASFTVNADPAPTARLTVNVEVIEPPGQDFVAGNQEGVRTVTLNAGATSTTFTVPTVNDNTDEDDGTLQVFVNDGTGYSAGQGAVVTVRDDDDPTPRVSFALGTSTVPEAGGTGEVDVVLTAPAPSGGLTLRYSVAGTGTAGSGNDFTIQNSGTVSVAAGTASATISVVINDDSTVENAETVILTLAGGAGYTLGSTTVQTLTITDNDGPTLPSASFTSASSSAAESAGTQSLPVDLSSAAPSGGLTLRYSVTGSAVPGSGNDFTIQSSGTVSVAAGDTSTTISVAINDDGAVENAETVVLTLTGGTGYTVGAPSVHTLTITDNDGTGQAILSLSGPAGADEGDSGTSDKYFTVSLSRAPSRFVSWRLCFTGTATIDASGGGTIPANADYQAISGQTPIDLSGRSPVCTDRLFRPSSSLANTDIGVRIKGDTDSESDETVIATLSIDDGPADVVLGTSAATYTIRNDDDISLPTAASFASRSSTAAENAGTRNVRVDLSQAAPSGGLTLSYGVTGTATVGSDFTIRNSGTLRIAAAATSAVIPITINDDATREYAETVILTLTGGTGYTLGSRRVHRLTITDNDDPDALEMATVSVSDAQGYKACESITFTISVSRAIDAETEPNGIGISIRTRESEPVSAEEGTDFHAKAETFQLSPGDNLQKKFRVRLVESPNEGRAPKTFEVVLHNVTGAEIGDGVAIGTILDDFPIAGCSVNQAHAPLVPSWSNPLREGLVRIVNPSAQAGEVRVVAIDDAGWRSAPLTLAIGAGESVQFTSRDLEWGNAAMGLKGATGPGTGDWRLEIASNVDVQVLPYARAADGTLNAMGSVAPVADNVHRVALFGPADSTGAASKLRLTNRGAQALHANITGVDDTGVSPGGIVSVELEADESVLLAAQELEAGGPNLLGALGDGEGQWRLRIDSDGDLAVMNLIETSDGRLANLSGVTTTVVPARKAHVVTHFPSSAEASTEGVVRIVNRSGNRASIRIQPHDSTGWRYPSLTLTLGAGEAANLDAWDLEQGNASKGLAGSTGPGTSGPWRLEILSDTDINVLTFARSADGLRGPLPGDAAADRNEAAR